jgi:hypothetical protein
MKTINDEYYLLRDRFLEYPRNSYLLSAIKKISSLESTERLKMVRNRFLGLIGIRADIDKLKRKALTLLIWEIYLKVEEVNN